MMNPQALSHAERKEAHRARLRDALPGAGELAGCLQAVLGDGVGTVTVGARAPNEYASSFPSEIVTCGLADGRELRVLCKYAVGRDHSAFGHRGNVAYEAEVYRNVLLPIDCSVPRAYGAHVVDGRDDCWLVLEYAEDAVRLEYAGERAATLGEAARWIGRFHAVNQRRVDDPTLSFLTRYDAAYLRRWARRTASLGSGLREHQPWLAAVCERFGGVVEALLHGASIIHGEYTPKNILIQGGRIRPVDWESAAVAPGEIDLASLTDGSWPAELVAHAWHEYAAARWPTGAPPEFTARLDLARLYWNFRWLGERAAWTTGERGRRRLQCVRQIAERAGLL